MEKEINDFRIANMFWEEFYARHIKELTFYIRKINMENVVEFDNIDDLRQFDSDFLLNVDSDIIDNRNKIIQHFSFESIRNKVRNSFLTIEQSLHDN